MRISIDGEEQSPGKKVERRIRLRSASKRPVEGQSLDERGATKRFKRSLWWTYGFIYPALLIGWIISIPKAQGSGGTILFVTLLTIGFGVLIAYFHRREIKRWRERSAARLADLPPVGTKASANPDTLTISGSTYPWGSLKAEAVDFAIKKAKRSSWLEVDRIRMMSNDGKTFMLDSFGYTNGNKLVDVAAEKLWPQILPVVNGEPA